MNEIKVFDDPGAPDEMSEEFRRDIADLINRRLAKQSEAIKDAECQS